MKHNYLKSLVFLLATVLLSCSKDTEDVTPAATFENPVVQQAKQSFDALLLTQAGQPDSVAAQGSAKTTLCRGLIKSADWAKATTRQLSIGEAVEVPLVFSKELYAEAKGSQTKLPLSGLAHLLLYRNTAGKWQAEVVTRLPDAAYLEGTDPGRPFTGTVLVEDWQGNFLRGFRYRQGEEGIQPISAPRAVAAPSEKQVQQYMPKDYSCTYTDWYSCGGGECHYMYTEVSCGGGGVGGYDGGGYSGGGPSGGDYGGSGGYHGGGGSGSSTPAPPLIPPSERFVASINDSKLAPCMQSIMEDLKNLTKGVGQIVVKFAGDTPGYNWTVKDGTLNAGVTGETNTAYDKATGTVTTTFDSGKFPKASDLSVARTILHESVHAYIVAASYNSISVEEKQKLFGPDWIFVFDNYNHDYMGKNYVTPIADALQEYGSKRGYRLPRQFYEDMAWAGLEGTSYFDALSPTEQKRIQDTLSAELSGRDRSGNYKAQRGKSAGC